MAQYRLTTVWRIEAPLQQVYDAICRPVRWPSWWWGVRRVVELEPGDARGIGRVLRCTWQGLLPYALTFDVRVVRVEPLAAVEGVASGDFEGIGRWRFAQRGPVTSVRYEWQVRTTRRWMNLLAPAARPLFEWNHNLLMRAGAEGLARLLEARLLDARHR